MPKYKHYPKIWPCWWCNNTGFEIEKVKFYKNYRTEKSNPCSVCNGKGYKILAKSIERYKIV